MRDGFYSSLGKWTPPYFEAYFEYDSTREILGVLSKGPFREILMEKGEGGRMWGGE